MAGLQRSAISFRRQGSSGLVWEDRVLAEDPNQTKKKEEEEGGGVEFRELRPSQSVGSSGIRERSLPAATTMQRSRSGGAGRTWRSLKVSPAIDPPSPKMSGCGFCVFGKSAGGAKRSKKTSRKR
ncbi:MAPK kinase substrate protein At1g80180-like [Magnolia sinica]|uniref:MAPK kinase substrate protein At1g80180-like n=1 Tax=Magnolia sinica TaxID=86752 RepID=UPI00265AB302|nr:MAPK kinase substrate protein At1g80180-like [Magnolia sinica]